MAQGHTPTGLAELMQLNQVLVYQKNTMMHNKYTISTADGKVIMYAKENSSMLGAMLGGSARSFHIDIFDTDEKPIIGLRRPYTFGPDKMEVSVCGRLASIVRQEITFLKRVICVNDSSDKLVLKVKSDRMPTSGSCDYEVYTARKQRIGVISKKWGGVMREMLTRSDQFKVTFPVDLDVRYKAALIGTCMLIDFLYYEN